MDLLTTVRKEGSRGGTGDFKWSDVQSSTRRENYLGHSLMAPVGRWQKGKVLDWYAKGDTEKREGETDTERAARERKEEIRRVKEAEQDALARALGFEVAPRNPNMEALGDKRDVDRVLKEAVEDADGQGAKGVGFGSLGAEGGPKPQFGDDERIEGNAEGQDAELSKALQEYKRRHRGDADSPRSRSKSKERERRHHRHHGRDRERDRDRERRRRSRSREHHRSRRERSRSRSTGRDKRLHAGEAGREYGRSGRRSDRSRSPRRRIDNRDGRYGRDDYDR